MDVWGDIGASRNNGESIQKNTENCIETGAI